jgi:putative glycosyltransferase (TIGR04348 family)
VTALRWAAILRSLGHSVRIVPPSFGQEWGAGCDALIALHAVKSAAVVADFKQNHPYRPVVVALTGTDVFQDGSTAGVLAKTLDAADRVVVLQNHMRGAMPPEHRAKVRVIFQSFTPPPDLSLPRTDRFEVCVLGHLRAVKDPLLAAEAVRGLPSDSRLHVVQVGGVLEAEYTMRAEQEQATNRRYEWRGELPRADAVRTLAGCRLLVMSSRSEGGPSAVSEAVACGVSVLSTPTSGVVGLLGERYPGYFPVGDAVALRGLLLRCELDPAFLSELRAGCDTMKPLVTPDAERAAWAELLAELGVAV